jgi:hypothetical protein
METEPQVHNLVHLDPGSAMAGNVNVTGPGRPTAVEKVKVKRLCIAASKA